MKLIYLLALGLLLVPVLADQRDGSNGIGYLPPDPSLKTSDPFIANLGGQYIGAVQDSSYALPGVFGGQVPIVEKPIDFMNLSEHNKKLDTNVTKITAINSYALTEYQMTKANITLGAESWL